MLNIMIAMDWQNPNLIKQFCENGGFREKIHNIKGNTCGLEVSYSSGILYACHYKLKYRKPAIRTTESPAN